MIRTIIFDFGGVIIDIDYLRVIRKFENYGVNDFKKRFSKAIQDDFFQKVEIGMVPKEVFLETIRSFSGKKINDKQIVLAWNAILKNYPSHRIDLLQEVKEYYTTILLSNTNSFHIEAAMKLYQNNYTIPFENLFDKIYWSYEIGLRKPDNEIFQFVMQKHNLKAEEIFFIDDSIQHIEAAARLGIQTHHLKEGEDVAQLFEKGRLKFC